VFSFEEYEDNSLLPVPITPSSGPLIPTLDNSSSEDEEEEDMDKTVENQNHSRRVRHVFYPVVVSVETSSVDEAPTVVVESKGIANLKVAPGTTSAGLDLGTDATATNYGALAA
jgi:hypothetical protein